MKLITRNLKAILTFVTNVGTQTVWQVVAAAVFGSLLGPWPTIILGALIAAAIVWIFPNDKS